ncbi:MAG: isoprenoid biosynthesis glyoxalase ElbB [Acidobacteria bacterium]|nr:isoprenoid biosynthesis glyoxalase ElbB [Acidobacteriota bacterium]MBI3658536.1 isoprenoid biosynthesis glyoxalase ElbB [Acidobacteriota bacterium]
MIRVGVVLSGCGVMDGSEIHEAVCTMLALDQAGAEIICMAPNQPQTDVIDHRTNVAAGESRNALVEAARIARGHIRDIAAVRADDLDAVILPGGFGATKNLCTFAADGDRCKVNAAVECLLRDMHRQGKPIGALCIAPVLLARLFGPDYKVELTIGRNPDVAEKLERMGARHKSAAAHEIIVDKKNKIVTCPCYMLAERISEVYQGACRTVEEVLRLTRE